MVKINSSGEEKKKTSKQRKYTQEPKYNMHLWQEDKNKMCSL